MKPTTPPGWMPLTMLAGRFESNLTALATRYPAVADSVRSHTPAEPYFLRSVSDQIEIAIGTGDQFRVKPTTLSPAAAVGVMKHLCPTGKITESILIAGEDQGWLWNAMVTLPSESSKAVGHRPPLYLMIADLERFWVMLHLQEWVSLLCDPRNRLFVGPNFAADLENALVHDVMVPWPASTVILDKAMFTEGQSPNTIVGAARIRQEHELNRMARTDADRGRQILERIRSGSPLRILAFTTRYSTFIQHSTRDWLAGFEALGHTTKLSIESADHEVPSNLVMAAETYAFRPDLVVSIDHCRKSLSGVPAHVPVAMWVQDKLPNIYDLKTGQSQGPLDFVLGYGRLDLSQNYGYPASRFMPTMMATNENRFTPDRRPESELARFRCDVSYVSHASKTADQIVTDAKGTVPAPVQALIDDLYDQVRAIYDAGGAIGSGHIVTEMIRRALIERRFTPEMDGLFDLMFHRVNNALFRQQTLVWISESGFDLRLYGKGWERHPTLSKHACGEADNAADLLAIYQASAINLQVTPFGAVHQRLLDGLVAGGFFLMRSVSADEEELLRRRMWNWCAARGIVDGPTMFDRRDAEFIEMAGRYTALGAINPLEQPEMVFAALEECALSGFTRTPETLFENAADVTFSIRDELVSKMNRFLESPEERTAIAAVMRERVLATHTYRGIAGRLVKFVRNDLRGTGSHPVGAAIAA